MLPRGELDWTSLMLRRDTLSGSGLRAHNDELRESITREVVPISRDEQNFSGGQVPAGRVGSWIKESWGKLGVHLQESGVPGCDMIPVMSL